MSTAAISIIAAVGDQLDRIGAIAGLASVIGLGVMSMLYFAQAREVKRLREWAGRAPERAAELEQRVQTDAQRRVTGQPLAPTTTAAQQQAAAAAALYAKVPPPAPPPPAPLVPQMGQLARPGVPVATATPSTPTAINTPAPGSVPVSAVTATAATPPFPRPTPTPTPAASPIPSPAASTAGGATQAPTPAPTATRTAAATKAPPAQSTAYPTAATAGAAASAARASTPTSTIGNGFGEQHTQASAAARPSPPPEPPTRTPEQDYDDGFSPGRLLAIIGGAVVVLIVAVGLMLALTGDEPRPPQNNIGGAAAPPAPDAAQDPGTPADDEPSGAAGSNAVDRPATNVAVLNGTTQAGLARGVADKLEKAKFTISTVGNNADQRVPQTVVSYTEGNERAANIVADAINVDRSVVQPSDRNATVAAEADVVVTVGTDQIE